MKNIKKILALLTACLMMIAAAGCGGDNAADSGTKAPSNGKRVGVAMPTQSSQRWIQDGANMKQKLEALGYEVDLQYAEDDVQAQVSQIENMITNGANCLVVASIDSSALVNALAQAKAHNVPVIAYDRLLMDTDSVSYYATFDNKAVGTLIGKYVEEKLGLKEGKGPYNVEFFAGSPDDNNAHFLNDGVFEVLKPYIDKGQLVVPSGRRTSIRSARSVGRRKPRRSAWKISFRDTTRTERNSMLSSPPLMASAMALRLHSRVQATRSVRTGRSSPDRMQSSWRRRTSFRASRP